jgi:hypothetical protein
MVVDLLAFKFVETMIIRCVECDHILEESRDIFLSEYIVISRLGRFFALKLYQQSRNYLL